MHQTVHLHYENWPDHQEAPDIRALEMLIEQRDRLAKPDDVCMLNCKATIGRSGLFFYSDLAKNRIKAMRDEGVPLDAMTFNFAAMVLEVRRYRPILSGNFTQLGQVFELIADQYDKFILDQKMLDEKAEVVKA